VALLDVNMLIALAWPSHVHHQPAVSWFKSNHAVGWSTCPMTQCAFVRVSSNPRIIPEAVTPCEAVALLREMTSLTHHRFWPDSLPFHEAPIPTALITGHHQVSDAYLLGLAIHHKGKLVTFDRGMAELLPERSGHRSALEIITA